MNQVSNTSPQMQEFLAAPASPQVPKASFSTHGIWGPGVRWMRTMNFAAKAGLISILFVIPLAWISSAYFTAQLTSVAFSAKERLGVEYNREVFPLLDLAQQLRRDASAAAVGGGPPASLAEVKSKFQAQQSKLAAVDKRLGAELGTAELYAAVGKSLAETERATGLEATFIAHSNHVQALIALLQGVTDNSNLTLDPDLDSYYVMDAVMFRVPDIVENSGKLRGLGLAIMKSGTATSTQQRALSEWIPIAEFQLTNMVGGLAKSFTANADAKAKINVGDTLTDTAAFFALARKSVIDSQDFTPQAQVAYLAASTKAIDGQYALSQRMLTELDELLAKRIAGIQKDMTVSLAILAVMVFLALYFFYSFFLVTRGGLRLISRHLQEMAEGDLRTAPFRPWGRDEPAMVIQDLRKTYDALHMLIRRVRHSARALHAASGEISSASNDLSARTEGAAASLEQQASAMEEIGSTVGGTAERAQAAATFALDNAHVAEKGGQVFNQVVTTMREIHASSSQIGDIISVIDGIAFQTNILALNAAVEAARAGEQGRGFAVVATEVRTLAQRSAAAAREIKTLINTSVERAESGSRVVEEAGNAMTAVVSNAKKINDYLEEISISSRQQAIGVTEVGKAIQELDRNTQQNAALVEQTSAAAGSLAQQADALQDEIANFRVA